ncbi:MAG: YegP family protein, partial [Clostridia bacterium]|nr:YegP family protein [Clostridia bacterium]
KKEDNENKAADKTEKAPDNNSANEEQAVTVASAAEAIIIPQKDNPIILPSGEIKSDKNQEKSPNKPIIDQNDDNKKDVKEASSRQVVATNEEKQRIIIKADSEQDAPKQAGKEDKKEVLKESQTATCPQQKPKAKYTGKWQIYSENGRYAANLVASNGEVLLRTESYSALSGIKSGIETIKNNIERDNFALSVDKNGNYFFKLFSSSTRLLCISEAYTTKAVCESAINSVKRFSKTAVIEVLKEEDQ